MFTDVQVKYLGCFFDDATRRLKILLSASSTNTPTECLRRCSEAGYIYSGVQVYFIVMTYFKLKDAMPVSFGQKGLHLTF